MKTLIIATITIAFLLPNLGFSEDQILVEAKATRVDANGKEEIFASPRAVTSDGTQATLSVTRAHKVPDSVGGSDEFVQTGSIMVVTPTIEGDSIRFRAHLTVREAGDGECILTERGQVKRLQPHRGRDCWAVDRGIQLRLAPFR